MQKIITLLSTILLFSLLQVPAQTKRALVIGIGEQEDRNWAKINGDKDIPYVVEMLTRIGYKDIRTLANKQATKTKIVSAFHQLASKCSKGDIVYIHFSGHGQLVTDLNGDDQNGWDEAWIPYDAYLSYCDSDTGEKHLIDDETNVLLTNIKNKIGSDGALLVVVDACHSGGSTRGNDAYETVRGTFHEFIIPNGQHPKENISTFAEQWLTLSACKSNQLNQEMKEPLVGKLTYALYSISEKGDVTMDEIIEFMQRHRGRLPQKPELTPEASTLRLSDFFKAEEVIMTNSSREDTKNEELPAPAKNEGVSSGNQQEQEDVYKSIVKEQVNIPSEKEQPFSKVPDIHPSENGLVNSIYWLLGIIVIMVAGFYLFRKMSVTNKDKESQNSEKD